MVESGTLLRCYTKQLVSGVRIPPSPPAYFSVGKMAEDPIRSEAKFRAKARKTAEMTNNLMDLFLGRTRKSHHLYVQKLLLTHNLDFYP